MCDEWMPTVTLNMTREQFEQLPRNPAYLYDHLHETVFLTPQPKHYHAVLDLERWAASESEDAAFHIRPPAPEDEELFPEVFADAFEHVQPFGGLSREPRLAAARLVLGRTWQGGDGPLVRQASFSAVRPAQSPSKPVGAVLITLVPGGDPAQTESYRWPGPPPRDLQEGPLGQPHLTWIFVSPVWKTTGLGSILLGHSVTALRELGYRSLWTTFLLGNDASMLWHWRNGFTLAAFPMSRRLRRREARA